MARLEELTRGASVKGILPDCRWDLIVSDEAHKMSATFFGGEIKYTKRHRLGLLLSTLTVSRNEILYSLNTPEDFILGMVEFTGDDHRVHYLRRPFQREPDFHVTSVNYSFPELLARAEAPR